MACHWIRSEPHVTVAQPAMQLFLPLFPQLEDVPNLRYRPCDTCTLFISSLYVGTPIGLDISLDSVGAVVS